MKEPRRGTKPNVRLFLKALLVRGLPLERETSLFILVSALDVFMTYVLLRLTADGKVRVAFVESNSIARFFLETWNIQGMVFFKFGMVAFVTLIAQIVAYKKLETARRLLNLATMIVGVVVVYSLSLLLRNLH